MPGPKISDLQTLIAAGIDPKTKLPLKMPTQSKLKTDLKIQLRVKDEQDAVNRFKWYNTGLDLSSQEIERMLYHKYELAFFYFEPLDKFMLLPFALNGGLDLYGRYQYITPVPYTYGSSQNDKRIEKAQNDLLSKLKLKVIYDVQLPEDFINEDGSINITKAKELTTHSAVIIKDYTPQFNQNNAIARGLMQESLLDVMSECIPYMRTNLKNATGVKGMRVNNEADYSNVLLANKSFTDAALNGDQNIPILGSIEFQELTNGAATDSLQFLQALQGLNNFRLSLYGLENTGLYEKNAYVNNLQSGVSNVGLSLDDCKTQRQHSCNIINSIWGLNMWADISEVVSGMDKNVDGMVYEEEQPDQTSNEIVNEGVEINE